MSSSPPASVERIAVHAAARVPGGNTNAYLVGDDETVLIDPPARTDELDEAVSVRDVTHLAVTHTHPDHVGGVDAYASALDVTVWARAGRERDFERATGVAPDRTFRGGTVVGSTTVIETPGHASDHVSFAVGDVAVIGDVAFASGSVVIGRSGDLRAYLTTLRRLRVRGFERLHPGHGPAIEDPVATLERLLRHRLEREARVRRAVQSGASTPEEIVYAVYEKDLDGAYDFAVLTVRAHLRKLAVEGDLHWDGTRAVPR